MDDNFRLEETDIAAPREGEVLLRIIYLSLDPYMRGRMNAGPSYAPPVEVGQVMTGGTVSEVMESKAPELRAGDLVVGNTGWQEYCVAGGSALQRIDPNLAPISTALGVLGMPGMTAYTGLLHIGRPKEGETVVVSSAAGAVGSAVGQIAKIIGCRAVGVAGGKAKCEFVASELGFDACVDYRSPKFAEELRAACPKGIDVYFENVGGQVLEAVVPLMNLFGRVPVCGLIAQYNAACLPPGPDRMPLLMWAILVKRLTFRGFIIFDFADQRPEFEREMSRWVREGRVKYREDVVEGLENAVAAFKRLFTGQNFGKLLVRVAPESLKS
jgi:NADPH-dependent curcumin reductase